MPEPTSSEKTALPRQPPGQSVLNIPRRFLLLISITYLLMLAPLVYFQRSLIYVPTRCAPLRANQVGFPVALFDLVIKTFDGLDLNGWVALAGTSSHSEPIDLEQTLSNGRPVVLFFPGNAGNRANRYTQIMALTSLGAHVVIVDYRGYAENPGQPSEQNFARDARSIWDHLTGELAVPAHRIILYGESLGGGSAIRLASELCQEGIQPGGLIAQSTFSSLVAAAQYHFPIAPVSLILVDRFPSDQRIGHVTCPILQIHGMLDSIVPFRIGQKLFDAAPATSSTGVPKRQVVLAQTDHNDVYHSEDTETMKSELSQFIDAVAAAPTPDQIAARQTNPTPNAKAEPKPFDLLGSTILRTLAVLVFALLVWWLLRQKPLTEP